MDHLLFALGAAQELGASALSKRPTSCMLLVPKALKGTGETDAEFDALYADVERRVRAAMPVF